MTDALKERVGHIHRDMEAVQRLLESMSNVLRENLVSLSGHDKATGDMRTYMVGAARELQTKVEDMTASVEGLLGFREAFEDVQEEFEEGMAAIRRMEAEMMAFYGLGREANPNPLHRSIREALRLIRELSERDPESGEPLKGWELWWRRISHVTHTAIAIAVVAAIWMVLKPFLAAAFGAGSHLSH